MLTIIRKMLGIVPCNEFDKVAFYEDGWTDVRRRVGKNLKLACAFPSASARRAAYKSCPQLYEYQDGSIHELLVDVFRPESLTAIRRTIAWGDSCELSRAHTFVPNRRIIAVKF